MELGSTLLALDPSTGHDIKSIQFRSHSHILFPKLIIPTHSWSSKSPLSRNIRHRNCSLHVESSHNTFLNRTSLTRLADKNVTAESLERLLRIREVPGFKISARRPPIQTGFREFPQSLQENFAIVTTASFHTLFLAIAYSSFCHYKLK